MKKEFLPTDEQLEILNIENGSHLVLAPPGSGKTELLAHRVFNAKNNGVNDSEMICLTFTNRAAKGMQERIGDKYPNNNIIIGNIHHFCSLFLTKNKLIPINASVLDEEEADQIIEELKVEFSYPPFKINKNGGIIIRRDGTPIKEIISNQNLLKLATYLKQKELGFSENLFLKPKQSEIPAPWKAKELCEAYNREKYANNYLDFDDLLTLTYYHLTNMDKALLQLSQFKWIQVDEVQDLNPLQWAIINKIAIIESLAVYFGDYEQAIFSFMGAKLDSLHDLINRCKIHYLVKNFRSPSYLLDIYIKYAETNWNPTWGQRPYPHISQEPPLNSLCTFRIEGDIGCEAKYISKKIVPNLIRDNELTAIIVRFNKSADLISSELEKQSIQHFKISGFDLFRRKPVKGLIAFLSIFQNEYDRLSWARIFYNFEIIESLKKSRAFVNNLFMKGLTPFDILEYNGTFSRLSDFFNIYSNQEMVVFDTETTGLDTEQDDIIQIAAIKLVNGVIKDIFEIYINTEKDISESEKIHHISKRKLDLEGVSPENGLNDFLKFIGSDATLVAHNVKYDKNILFHNLKRYCNINLLTNVKYFFDTITITKLIYPSFSSYKLKDLLYNLKIDGVNSHNALDDVKATVSLIQKLNIDFCNGLEKSQNEYLSETVHRQIFNNFISKFGHIYSGVIKNLERNTSLYLLSRYYFEHYKNLFLPNDDNTKEKWINDWNKQMNEIAKLLKHIELYTSKASKLSLQEKIEKYVPEYKMFKESDLFLGTEKVVVSTVYKAKGLEFDNVIVAEANDDVYPCLWTLNNPTEQEVEDKILEDAKAFYVALTRSKKRLFISSHTTAPYGAPKALSRYFNSISSFFETVE